MQGERTLSLIPPSLLTLEEFHLGSLCLSPSKVISLGTRGEAEGSQVIGDVHKQAIRCLWEMIADSHSLVISSHDNIEEILLALVIAVATIIVVAPLHQMDGHLIVVVTDRGILAIDRIPGSILGGTFHLDDFHAFRPHLVGIHRDSHRRLYQMVVDVHTKFTSLYHCFASIVEMIEQPTLLLLENKVILAIRR